MTPRFAIAVAALALAGCRDRSPPPNDDAPHVRRVIERPTSAVYSLPPHAIQAEGAGPYKLGQPLATVLYSVPTGPVVEVLDIPGVVRLSAIRVEEGRILLGGDPVLTSFVSVLAPEVARTEKGVEVGSTRAAMATGLGDPLVDPPRVLDPRLSAFAALPGARFVVMDEQVRAIVITLPAPRPDERPPAPPSCDRSAPASALKTALGGEPDRVACLTGDDAVAAVGDEVVLFAVGGERPRRIAGLRVPGLQFVGAAHIASEGKAGALRDIIAVAMKRDDKQVTYSVIAARPDAGKLVKLLDEPAYQITATNAGWIGAALDDLDLLLEIEARSDALAVSGVLLHRADGGIRLAVPLAPITIGRRRRPSVEPGGPGPGETTVQPLGDAAKARDAAPQ